MNLYIAAVVVSRSAARSFTLLAQYKPGKHAGIINKKHDEPIHPHTATIKDGASQRIELVFNELKSTQFLPKLDYPFRGCFADAFRARLIDLETTSLVKLAIKASTANILIQKYKIHLKKYA